MQISKNLFVLCAIALLATALHLRAAESEAQARAREALRQKMSELDAQEKGTPQPQTPPPTVAAPVTVTAVPVQQPVYSSTPVATDDEATARARATMRQKMAELDGQEPSTAQAWTGEKQVTYAPLMPLPAPPSSIPSHKQARLADLLRQYKADEITPEQYHKQRAMILTEP